MKPPTAPQDSGEPGASLRQENRSPETNLTTTPTASIYCTGCSKDVEARLTDGKEIYPHRPDLYSLPFWKCDTCNNCVGCHHKTSNPTRPLGVIATPELKRERMKIHALLDPLWKSGKISRKKLYQELTFRLGREYHTAELRNLYEVNEIIKALKGIIV